MSFLSGLLLACASSEITVALRAEARIRGTEVELAEIAEVSGLDAESVRRAAAFELGSAPAPGYSRLFVAERVRAELLRRLDGVTVRLAGERACRVYPEVETVPVEEILGAARAELERALAGREATFTARAEIQRAEVPVGVEGHAVRSTLVVPPTASGTVSVPVDLLVDGVRYRTVWTNWDVDLWETRAVLAKPVRAGDPLRADLLARSRVPVLGEARGEPLSAEELAGALAVRDLAAGECVTRDDVLRPKLVNPGETVFLRVRKGAIEACSAAVALEPGAIGDRIRVRILSAPDAVRGAAHPAARGALQPAGQELVATVKSRESCELDLGR